MADRPFIFRLGGQEVRLPITPSAYEVTTGMNVELINIHELGDVVLAGYKKLPPIKLSCMFPANNYSFSAANRDPEEYVAIFKDWINKKSKPRFVIGGTSVNEKVLIEDITESEKDGTNNIHATITLRPYRDLEVVQFTTNNTQRAAPTEGKSSTSLTIQKGDTISAYCRKYYGSSTPEMWDKLAAHNGIKNRDLIFTGDTIKIPQPLL